MTRMAGNQFPPRGPRSNHVKIDVTTEERKVAEGVAAKLGCTVVQAFKISIRHEAQRLADFKPSVEREASPAHRDEDGPVKP